MAVIIKDHKLYYVSVGDSRIYLIRKEEIAQITEDQNYRLTLKRELENNTLSQEEYLKEIPYADALISYIGMGGLKVIEYNSDYPLELKDGDKILLCSDGFYRSFSEKEIIEEVNGIENFSIEEDVKRMIEKAAQKNILQGKKQDNTSGILVIMPEDGRK